MTQIEEAPLVFHTLEAPFDRSEFFFSVLSFPLMLPLPPPKTDGLVPFGQNTMGHLGRGHGGMNARLQCCIKLLRTAWRMKWGAACEGDFYF